MDIFENLPNKEELKNYIETYAGYEDVYKNESPASLETLFRFWNKNKLSLFQLLDNNYILEKDIYYEKDSSELHDELYDLANSSKFALEFKKCFSYDSIYANQDWSATYDIRQLLSPEILVKNIYDKPTHHFLDKNGNDITAIHGTKATRVLKKFAEAFNLPGYEEFRLEHSRILNQKKIKGTLCLSIHPLDYFTMSDNSYGWDSCMNWTNGGCYRMGTVEMMNSPYIIVAYLKGKDKFRFYNHYWNSKKWRNLVIVSDSIITTIKGYPYCSEFFDEEVVKWVASLANKNWDTNFDNNAIGNYRPDYSEFYIYHKNRKYYLDFSTNDMYNDFGNNNYITYAFNDNNEKKEIYICYSGETECMYCGEVIIRPNEEDAGYLLCEDCFNRRTCENCNRIIGDDALELDGEYLCEECYSDLAVYDSFEDEYHNYNNCTKVYLVDDSEGPPVSYRDGDFTDGPILWSYVGFPFEKLEDEFEAVHVLNSGWRTIYYVLASEGNYNGLKRFKLYGEYD